MSEKKSLNRFDGLDGEPCAIPRFDSEADKVASAIDRLTAMIERKFPDVEVPLDVTDAANKFLTTDNPAISFVKAKTDIETQEVTGKNVFGGDLAVKCPVCQTVNFSRKDSYYECDFGHKWPKKSKDTPHLDDSEELGEKK